MFHKKHLYYLGHLRFFHLIFLSLWSVSFASRAAQPDDKVPVFNVLKYGAVGDGKTLATASIQQAIDAAAASKKRAQVLIPGGNRFLIGTLKLKGNIDFHLAAGSELLISPDKKDYTGEAVITARDAHNLTISGTGYLNGQDMKFMDHYEKENEWWIPKEWRPNLFELVACKNLVVRDITFGAAPRWGLHMIGCEKVLVDNIKIKNTLDVPNCDGIDPDHCRDVVIKNCDIVCGDDGIVIKATRQKKDFGPSANIRVYDCVIRTQDSGVKIGTETTSDIYDVVFERIKIISSCRGIGIQLRDEGNVRDITFKDITFESRYHSNPWWGRGEAISFTAIPRTPETKIGKVSNIKVINVTGKAENSVRISGTKESRLKAITFENVNITLDRWTAWPGNLFDNRPTTVYEGIEPHNTPGFSIRFADDVTLKNCSLNWGKNVPEYFSHALEAENTTNLKQENFKGTAAHPDKQKAVVIQ